MQKHKIAPRGGAHNIKIALGGGAHNIKIALGGGAQTHPKTYIRRARTTQIPICFESQLDYITIEYMRAEPGLHTCAKNINWHSI